MAVAELKDWVTELDAQTENMTTHKPSDQVRVAGGCFVCTR